MKKRILILNGQYLPGYKGGGPIQSCVNMVQNLSDKFDFYVLTADRDYKATYPYEGIKVNDWNKVGEANVFYMSPDKQSLKDFKNIFKEIEFDTVYLNGFFSPIFTIKPLLLRMIGGFKNKTVILTPRGDFTGGCENKKVKKYTYIFCAKIIGLYKDILWHATSELEEKDIKKFFKNAKVFTVPNLATKYVPKREFLQKKTKKLHLIFISRIFPKKNLKYALEVLSNVKNGEITFDIYGPMEDLQYWHECEKVIKKIPNNITVNYKGEVTHSKVNSILSNYHALFFPTLGENYGHVIVEAMMNNCIPILSKGVTPWDDYDEDGILLENLSNKNGFKEIINNLTLMDNDSFEMLVTKNKKYLMKKINSEHDRLKYYTHL
ncbi:hypothetical protein CHN50_17265 [Priestia aryabhattai]|nr:hypothetical protein CHN50_17265 [Priestia aryabhattai]